ncbi:transmembrane protein 121B-like [Mercenaria mercenaria]|uniref:transmembrane protein 121B-like n=1 Tax=Mercenaria mercenaria TaxID=6596 RepID=UPI00234E9A02|nr:transmembrane protein 121B-like [Mercenaria mercenaria]
MGGRRQAQRCMHHWTTRTLCLTIVILQAVSMNWYLMNNLSYTWAAIYGADAFVTVLFVISFLMASRNINIEKHNQDLTFSDLQHLPLTYISWFVYSAVMDIKIAVIFRTFSTDLGEAFFFGPNTLKTTIALTGIVFLSYLPTLNDVQHGHRKDIITTLTSTVVFDILDGVDNLENLFEKDVRDTYPQGLDYAIIAACCINFLLPTVPLFTLAKTKFGLEKLPVKLEMLHKFAIAYLVNLPLFVTRMITWHGLSQGISIFLLKNIMAMGVVTFEVCEKLLFIKKGKEENKANDSHNKPVDRYLHNRSSL